MWLLRSSDLPRCDRVADILVGSFHISCNLTADRGEAPNPPPFRLLSLGVVWCGNLTPPLFGITPLLRLL